MEILSLFIAVKNIVVFAVVLSILIVVHEWGHFITAKWVGVKVEEFALGFGKTLVSQIKGGTKFMIKAIPLGGYVRMAGDERAACKGEPDEFFSKPVGHRALIVLNGPVVNFFLAFVCFWLVFMLGYPGLSTKVEEIIKSGPAVESGIAAGDKIVSINGKRIYGAMHLERLLKGTDPDPILVGYERNGEKFSVSIVPKVKRDYDFLGLETDIRDIGVGFHSSVIGGLAEKKPAQDAGLAAGDKILRINGQPVEGWMLVHDLIAHSPSENIKIDVLRESEEISFVVKADTATVKNPIDGEKQVRRIGIGPVQDFSIYQFNPIASFSYSLEEFSFITVATYKALYNMVVGKISAKDSVTGPVGIFYIVNSAADEGLSHLLYILAVISASLAIFNLLPVIPLDGGHLMLLGIEKLRGKPLPDKIEEGVARVGFSLIICLAIFVFYSDFAKFGWIDGLINLWK